MEWLCVVVVASLPAHGLDDSYRHRVVADELLVDRQDDVPFPQPGQRGQIARLHTLHVHCQQRLAK